MQENKPVKDNKKLQALLIIILVTISASVVIGYKLTLKNEKVIETGPVLTTTYTALSAAEAYNLTLLNETPLIIADMRSCKCSYNSGHLPNATWNTNPYSFYNLTQDLLIYANDESESIEYCETLLNNTYSRLFYLSGGYDAWNSAGYTIEK